VYGYGAFREGQLEAIQSVNQGKDTLALIPTGGGKSIIYVVSALLMQGLTIVVEPLKCIMEEQAQKLRQKQIPAFFFNSSLTEKEMDFTVNQLCRPELTITSPECIMSAKLQKVLDKWNDRRMLSLIAVDEAHCIDNWGIGFRPNYLKLGSLKRFRVPLIALTGTATARNQNKIISTLNMDSPLVVKTSNSRINLHLQVMQKVNKPKGQIADFINTNCQGQQGIVYCARRKDTVDLACELKQANRAIFVHGDLKESDRKRNIQAWTTRHADVMCATKSFGMGVDEKGKVCNSYDIS
jgi:RecQ family ATP-dependent DNA helicase